MKIQHNIPALNTFRQMGVNNTGTAKALEKLSSGYRINRAGDDAAGLAISEKMRAQVRGLNRASANAQDGISLIQAAEGALQETHSVLQRMRELSVQAASDVNETIDRQAIADEMNQLKTEVDRIANTTEFNKKTILNGSLQDGAFSTKMLAGSAVLAGAHIDQSFAARKVTEAEGVTSGVSGVFNVAVTEVGQKYQASYEFNMQGLAEGDTVTINLGIADESEVIPSGGQTFEADVFTYTAVGDTNIDNAAFINGLKEALQSIVQDYDVNSSGNTITFTAKDIGEAYAGVTLASTHEGVGEYVDPIEFDAIEGADATIVITGTTTDGEAVEAELSTAEATQYVNGVFRDAGEDGTTGLIFEVGDLTNLNSTIVNVNAGRELVIQAGANTGKDQTIAVSIGTISASGLGIDNLDVSTHIAGQASLSAVESAISTVSTQRAELGAVQNRLEHTIANLDTVSENLQDAESRIRDVDMAKEMMNFTKFNILNQASQAMMAQANNLPQGVLQLLR